MEKKDRCVDISVIFGLFQSRVGSLQPLTRFFPGWRNSSAFCSVGSTCPYNVLHRPGERYHGDFAHLVSSQMPRREEDQGRLGHGVSLAMVCSAIPCSQGRLPLRREPAAERRPWGGGWRGLSLLRTPLSCLGGSTRGPTSRTKRGRGGREPQTLRPTARGPAGENNSQLNSSNV